MLTNILYVLILLSGFAAGYLLAWLAKDELVSGRKWFAILAIAAVLCEIPVFLFLNPKTPALFTLLFIAIICLVSLWKSYDRKFVKGGIK